MFQRLTSLFFGEVEDVTTECKGPKPCVSDADEEGWLLVNLPAARLGEGDWVELGKDRTPLLKHSSPSNNLDGVGGVSRTRLLSPSPHDWCRTRTGGVITVAHSAPASPDWAVEAVLVAGPSPGPRGSTPPSPGSRSDCSSGFERCCMDESWFVTPPPCFTAEGATPEASPMEDLLIEHPSMSVYVSTGNQSITEETASIVLQETSQRVEPMPSAARSVSGRPTRGSVSQVTALAKVTQVSRVQRAKARAERRQLSRSRIQRQNRLREGVPRHSGHTRGSFLHQPCQRHFNY
ncbi:tumor protein p53-inducible nuclear protein 2 isoform X1 [Amia ocellicauda]|uniref:tumor protein p53-inducible nuclear protein 2 isoform X1 n=1 Tax=Amia ocellicauda TaxID=2972642 RepID=UPI003464058E